MHRPTRRSHVGTPTKQVSLLAFASENLPETEYPTPATENFNSLLDTKNRETGCNYNQHPQQSQPEEAGVAIAGWLG